MNKHKHFSTVKTHTKILWLESKKKCDKLTRLVEKWQFKTELNSPQNSQSKKKKKEKKERLFLSMSLNFRITPTLPYEFWM